MSRSASEERFRAVFDRTFVRAENVACRITGDASVSQDIAAEALTRLFSRWDRLADKDYVDAWVLRVAANLAIGVVRGRRRANRAAAAPSSEELIVLRVALAEALARLPRRQREVVVLRYVTDLPEREVAALLGVSAGSVKTHLHRGLAALRASMRISEDETMEALHAGDR